MSRHTPGPWNVTTYDGRIFVEPTGRPPMGEYICELGLPEADRINEDAALIAAAPDLLEALERLISAVEREHKARDAFNLLNPRTAEADEVDEVCFELEDAAATVVICENEARAAIARAKGGQP